MSAELQQVHVRVNDAATGKPTPCQVRFTDADGNYYAPHGRPDRFPAYPPRWWCRYFISGALAEGAAYIDGACEVSLPAGPLHVQIRKGPEYDLVDQDIHLPPGKLALRFELQRRIDPAASGWYSGAIVQLPLSPHDLLLEGAAEGLQVVDLLAYERETMRDGREQWFVPKGVGRTATADVTAVEGAGSPVERQLETLIDFPNLTAFSGQRPCLENAHCLVAVNTLNAHRMLGELALLHSHRIVFPLRFGLSTFDDSSWHKPDNWTLADWCDQCHRKRGLVVGVNVDVSRPTYGGETLANLILGKVDAITDGDDATWQLLLGLGLKVPRIADAIAARPVGGFGRTYAQIDPGEDWSYTNWIEAIRKGRTCVSRGPHLTLTANGRRLGDQIDLDRPERIVSVRADAQAIERFDRIEILRDGKVLHAANAAHGDRYTASTEVDIQIDQSGWLAARCIHLRHPDQVPFVHAHTSPIYVRVADQSPTNAAGVRVVLQCFNRMEDWLSRDARCNSDDNRARLLQVFADARHVLLAKHSP